MAFLSFLIFCFTALLPALAVTAAPIDSSRTVASTKIAPAVSFTVVVYDATAGSPIELARVSLYRSGTFVAGKVPGVDGRALFRDLIPGVYRVRVHTVGYNDVNDTLTIDATHSYDSVLQRQVGGEEVVVQGASEPTIGTVDPVSGNQVFEAETYHAPPTARMSELVQQNLNGAVRAPTGEVHIRGQHGEFT